MGWSDEDSGIILALKYMAIYAVFSNENAARQRTELPPMGSRPLQ
ncbi:hypothetical protein RRSWK_02251 [Rhodopirellula sp. SWK7]|nr:hypothetical protein RRSWK_02251 [Rhodopirellula sp. SWK7]